MPTSGRSSDSLEHRPQAVVSWEHQHQAQEEDDFKDVAAAASAAAALSPHSPVGTRRTISAPARRWRSPPKELLLSMALVTTTFLGGGLIFGFTPLAEKLVTLENGPFTDDNKGSVFAVGHNITVIGLIFSGFLLDRLGPRVCAVSGLLIEAVGHFGMMHAATMPQWVTWTAYGFVGLGGTQVLMAALTFAEAFQRPGLVNSSLTACYQAGGFVFMIMPYVDWLVFFRTYVLLCVGAAVACLLLYPDKPLSASGQAEEQSELADMASAIANSRSLKSVLTRPGTLMFLATFMIAGSALIYGQGEFATGTKAKAECEWVEHSFKNCKHESLYTSLNNVWFPLVGNFILPCSLLIGWLIDKCGFAIPAFINVFSVQAFLLAFWVLDLEWQFVTLVFYNIANTAIFTTQNAYVCFVGHQHIGALFAISNAVLGIGNLLSDVLTANPFGSGETRVNTSVAVSSVFWLLLCIPLYAWVPAEMFHRRRRRRQLDHFIVSVSAPNSRATSISGPGEEEGRAGTDVEADLVMATNIVKCSTGGAPSGSLIMAPGLESSPGSGSAIAVRPDSGSAGAPLLSQVADLAHREQWSSHNDPEIQWHPVVTVRPVEWEEKVQRMLAAGRDRVCLLLDFDRTVTRCYKEDGSRSLDCHDILASIPKISNECKRMMEALMDKYYPIEIDPVMTKEEKTPHMVEWYTLVNGLLERQNLTRDDVRIAVSQCQDFRLRHGVEELITSAVSKGIPIVIVSAGLGNIIQEVVEQRIWQPAGLKGSPWQSIRVLSNNLLWDASGQQTGFSEPLIHMYNKSLADAPIDVQTLLRGRDKVLLCGDSTGDLTIAHGHDTTDVLKVGFLNEKIKERLPKYVGNDGYDRVILNDGTFEPVLEIMRKL